MMKNNKIIDQLTEMRSVVGWGKHLNKKRLEVVLKYSGVKVLDVGCSSGSYVKYLYYKGYDAYGCDILSDPNWGVEMKSRLKVADINKLPYKNNSFDTLLLFDILEHIKEPELVLKKLSKLVKKNLILTVPNCDQPEEFRTSGLAFHHWIDRTHVQFFRKESIRKILNRNGYKVILVEFIDPAMPETLFLSGWHFPLRLAKWIGMFCQFLPFRKKYFLAILIVAEKI